MDLDSFLAPARWDILKIIAGRPSSPIEIAEQTGTTVSYVSQQLKLLEAKGLVAKKKTGAFEKGQPRNVFSITEEFVHVTVLAQGYAEKKKVELDDRKTAILGVWSLKDSEFKRELEKFFAFFEHYSEVEGFAVDLNKNVLLIVSKDLSKKTLVEEVIKKLGLKLITKLISPNKCDVSNSLFLTSRLNKIIDAEKLDNLKGGNDE